MVFRRRAFGKLYIVGRCTFGDSESIFIDFVIVLYIFYIT